MDPNLRIKAALHSAIHDAAGQACPPKLTEALTYAVFPGGHRIRPRLCLAVARAHGDDAPDLTDAALASIEFLHCASLVHDDLPCFDNADLRRGKPSVHRAFGEPLALLAGDALILLAFQTLARVAHRWPERTARLMSVVADGVGAPNGIVAGQAWECEDAAPLAQYQQAKTGSLFAAATMAGAVAAGADASPWGTLGQRIGGAYQIADDVLDSYGDPDVIGKPVGQDQAGNRPNAVAAMGVDAAAQHLQKVVERAVAAVPACPGELALRELIREEATRFMELALKSRAAA